MGDFQRCLAIELKFEGGKVDDPRDPGGRTNQGIIQRVYDDYRRRGGLPTQDVYKLADIERDDIYRSSYWNLIRGDELPSGVDLVTMDGAVNSGVHQSIKWLQRALGVNDDGVFGPATMAAVKAAEPVALINAICDKRMVFLKQLKTFKTFGNGWTARVSKVRAMAVLWAGSPTRQPASVTPVVAIQDAAPKAMVEDTKTAPSKAPGDVSTGLGLGAGGISATVQTLQEQLTPYSFAGGWITKLVIALAVLSALLLVGGLVWRWWASRKAEQIEANK